MGDRIAVRQRGDDRVDVTVGGEPFTSYLTDEAAPVLTKPVLVPLRTPNGTPITRGYPLSPRGGERVDHPHHIGLWFTYGDVNGHDFWNASGPLDGDAGSATRDYADQHPRIRHREIRDTEDGEGQGRLAVSAEWIESGGRTALLEETAYVFRASPDALTIDRETTLTARSDVSLGDDKEGLLGLRVRRELEHPSGEPVVLTDVTGQPAAKPSLDEGDVTGEYRSSEGERGTDVWGTRARWVALDGRIDEEDVTVAIFDHPDNVGHPTYWHARGYGLFAANPLGQAVFSDGETHLGFSLESGESTTFRHRISVFSGRPDSASLEESYEQFVG